MPFFHQPHHEFPIYHEYSISIKERAFKAMSELEGWCSEEKAAVLMDLILAKSLQTIVEIGVYGGRSLVPMAFAVKELGKGIVWGIDPWSRACSAEGMEGEHAEWWSQLDHDKILFHLLRKISEFRLLGEIGLIRATSEQSPLIQEIDLLHVDGNHSAESALFDVKKWVPLVKKGGFIVFDDLDWSSTTGAVKWLEDNAIKMAEFTGDNNRWAIWIKP